MLTAAQVKAKAREAGADLVGIASPDRFQDVPAERNPLSIFPHAKSIIVLARRITRGSLRGVEEGTHFNSYHMFGYHSLDADFVALTTFEVVSFLEDQGWEATPLFPFPPEAYPQGIQVREGAPAPNVYPDFDYAAVAAGLGEMGLNQELLTPEFGHRQRFATLLTDEELEPDPVLPPNSLCKECRACIDACPLNAFATSTHKEGVPEYECEVADCDSKVCAKCENGAWILPGRFDHVDRCASSCGRECLVALEKKGALSNKFQNEFRKRSVWKNDVPGRAR